MSLLPAILNNDVKKPTALVHFERELSPVEQKVMTLIIFHCQVSKKDGKGFYYIKKSLIREFIGWEDSNNYPRIYEAFESIFNNAIKWNFLGQDRTFKGLKCKLIVSLLEPSETGQYIGFQLHHELEPLIRDPRVFAKLKLIMMVLLTKPKYGYSLYELAADSYSRGQRTLKISLKMLKSYLGIPEGGYPAFKDFKNRVLKPSVESVNKISDYNLQYDTYREGRAIAGIIFYIAKQPWQPPLLLGPLRELERYYSMELETLEVQGLLSPEEQAFVDSVQSYQVAESEARLALEIYGLEGAIEIRDYVLAEAQRRNHKKNRVRDIGAYMVRCFREGYGRGNNQERILNARKKMIQAIKASEEETREHIRQEVEKIKRDFWHHQTQLVDEKINAMSEGAKQQLEEQFLKTNPIWAKRFRESGLNMPLVKSAFYHFAAEALLVPEQRDIGAFARSHDVSLEVINVLESLGP